MNLFNWIKANPIGFAVILGVVFTTVMRFLAPGGRAAAVFGGVFPDLVKVFCAIAGVPMPGGFSPAPASIPSTTTADAKMPTPVPAKPPPIAGAMLVLGAVLLGGCSWFSSHAPAVVHGAADVVICVLEHDSEPIAKIAEDCYGIAEADVVTILAAHKQAMAREAVKPQASSCPTPAPSASAPVAP